MGAVKPTGASHKAEISQYLCGFSIPVYSFYHPSAQKEKKNKTKNFCHSWNCKSIFFSFCISSSLWGWGQERRRMCVLKSTHNQCTCRYLASYIYKLSSEATSAGEEKNPIWIRNLKWDQFYWPTSLIHSPPCWPKKPRKLVTYNPSKTLPPHSLLCCPQPGCPSSAVPHKTPFNKTLFAAVKQRDARPFQSTAAFPSPPWSRAAELPTFRLLWLNFDLLSQAVCVLESLWLAA